MSACFVWAVRKKNRGGAIKESRYDSALLWNIIQVKQTQVVFYSKKSQCVFLEDIKLTKGHYFSHSYPTSRSW